jgi:hypothetical protein
VTDASNWLPYRLLGATGRARLQQKLEGVVRRWLDAWGGREALASGVRVLGDDHAPAVASAPCHAFRVRAGAATAAEVRLYPYRLARVLGVPLDRWSPVTPSASSRSLAGRLWQAVMRALVNELMDSASIAAWELEASDPPAASRNRRGPTQGVSVIVGDDVVASLELAPLLVNALVPTGAAAGGARTEPRRRAIGGERIKIEAILGEAEMSLADFASLGEGDVVVLDAGLGGSCRLGVPGVAAVADAVLGRRGRARAVRVSRVQITNR